MRVFSQINNCQQKQNKKIKKQNKNKQKTDKTKRGAPLLGLAKSIYYVYWTGDCIIITVLIYLQLVQGTQGQTNAHLLLVYTCDVSEILMA